MPKAMIITVGTGRDRQDVAKAILFSIKQHNPEFIYFFVSSISGNETLPHITKEMNIHYDIKKYDEINDVEKIYFEYIKYIEELKSKGFEVKDIAADYTSGTKAMSAALVSASIALGIETISYVYGERDNTGRVIPGTERPMSFTPNRIFSYKFIDKARHFFNINHFESCIEICNLVEENNKISNIIEELSFLKNLACAYDSWDRFDFKSALEHLIKLKDNALIKKNRIKGKVEKNKAFIYQEKENKYCYERVIDLIANAKRRFNEEGRYDDGLARLYRAFEYLAQVKLYVDHQKIETENLDIQKLPISLCNKYMAKKNEAGKIQISLKAGYELLRDLNDNLGQKFMEDYMADRSFKLAFKMRNDSILAHGFSPIERKDANKLLEYLEKYLSISYPEYKNKLESATFPKLGI